VFLAPRRRPPTARLHSWKRSAPACGAPP